MSIFKQRVFLIICMILSAVLFIMVALNYQEPLLLNLDAWIQSHFYAFLGPLGTKVFIVVTYTGSIYIFVPLSIVLIGVWLFQQRYWTTIIFVFNLLSVRTMNWLLKSFFERPRPELEHLVEVSTDSFPSGHAMNSIAFFGFLGFLLHLKLKNMERSSWWAWILTVSLIGCIGLSRVYLGVHYPMDVLGGFLAGFTWLLVSVFLYTFVPKKELFNRFNESKTEGV